MFDRIWEDYIALNSQEEPVFEVLPPVSQLTERPIHNHDLDSLPFRDRIEEFAGLDRSPLPIAEDREGYYGPRHFEYWLSGLVSAQTTLDLANKYGVARRRYVEIGSASGRVIRHFSYLDSFSENWAFDINWRHICWINRYLPRNIIAIQNSSVPSLPLEDNSVDVFSAMSVFSHVETFELQWLAEVRRILRPGGMAMVSVQDNTQIAAMTPDWPVYNALVNHPRWNENFLDDLAKQGKLVVRWHADRSYSSNVLYHQDYIENVWGRLFEVDKQPGRPGDTQTIYVLRKR